MFTEILPRVPRRSPVLTTSSGSGATFLLDPRLFLSSETFTNSTFPTPNSSFWSTVTGMGRCSHSGCQNLTCSLAITS
ncbi:hypothetical protein L596_023407 [Steinernema carpocapsae]|uniref:Uncharacterized protein n=1 Tax=Steinernema carpocapsae TaxID=34508 RepID=A0A4U5MDS5_STECR|nr:hypothetical protein L596_023407 [Steinernema carpocapsae]